MKKRQRPKTARSYALMMVRMFLLFLSGAAYGFLVASLHDSGRVVPIHLNLDRHKPYYLTIWGIAGIVMGSLLPWIDSLYGEWLYEISAEEEQAKLRSNGGINGYTSDSKRNEYKDETTNTGSSWNPMVRSVGSFVGIAYAIRKLPWESTTQASATLALVNPVLWYLIDRSITGFWLSAFIGIFGTSILVGINPSFIVPAMIPSTSTIARGAFGNGLLLSDVGDMGSTEFIGVVTWIASVLYCSSVCFGNIGRLLVKIDKRETKDGW